MKSINIIEDVLIVGGVALSLTNIYTIMGIVLLSFQIVLILIKAGIKIYQHIKNGKMDEAVKDIEDAQKEIEDVTKKDK